MGEVLSLRTQSFYRKIAATLQALEAERELARCNHALGKISYGELEDVCQKSLEATLAVQDELTSFQKSAA